MPTLDALLTRAADTRPATWNADARTIEAVISTGAAVQRRDARGPYSERLDVQAIDPAGLVGVPVLDGHRQQGSEHIVGTIIDARRDGGALIATIRLSAALDVANVVTKVAEGILRGVSVGYAVTTWEDLPDPHDPKIRMRIARDWRVVEVSLVSVPADAAAQIRSVEEMTVETVTAETQDAPGVETRAAIREIARTAGMTPEWADQQIDAGADLLATRAAAFVEMQQRSGPTIRTQVGTSSEDPAVQFERAAEALACRMAGGTPSDAARPLMGLGLADHARLTLARAGVAGVNSMGREDLLTRAMNTTSDFPNLLTASGNRVLLPAYQAAASPLKMLARQTTANDFRPMSQIKLGDFGRLQKVGEAGEIKAVTTGEAVEGYSVETFAGLFNLSRQAIVNDDLGAFGRWSAMMGTAAADTEADQLIALLLASNGAGPIMGEDGKRLFHVDHGNLAAAGAAISVATLTAARLAMRTQKGLDGKSPINVTPKYLLVSPALETVGEQVLATLNANLIAEQNPFAGKLTLLVDARLTGNAWYVFADPATAAVLEWAYLSSAQGPQLASRDGWDVLGREFRVVLDFGCGAIDYRGAYRNAGA